MSPPKAAVTTCEIYDQALKYCRDFRLPPDQPRPAPTKEWPAENIIALERYRTWLSSGGASEEVIRCLYLTMAGHVLGLNLKPSAQLDLNIDLQKAMDYIVAKGHGPDWTDACRISLEKFRRFLRNERGQVVCNFTAYAVEEHTADLPGWLVQELVRYQRTKERNWREARLEENIRRYWSSHLRLWQFLVGQCGVQTLADVKRSHLSDFVDLRLKQNKSVRGINADLRTFHGFMAFLQDQGYPVPQALQRVPCLKEPDPLPRYLTDEEVIRLRDDFESRVVQARSSRQRRDALLDRALFYLLWQCGLRKGEVEELRQADLDFGGRRLTVRNGKGQADRTVYLAEGAVRAVREYLPVRGMGPTDHLFLYRNQPLFKDLLHARLKAAGERVGVTVHAHRLRHTCATQLLNAGCRVTSIQKLLGHKKLNTTMIYARAYDQTVEEDYFRAMGSVEQRLELMGQQPELEISVTPDALEQILALASQLSAPVLSADARLGIAAQIRLVLLGEAEVVPLFSTSLSGVLDHSPPEHVQAVE
jgi:site-specific recombinase XerD